MTADQMYQYHTDNPQIYDKFEEFTFQVIGSGRKYSGAKMIFERLRYYSTVEAKGQFKLNNDMTAYYSRLFEDRNPNHAGFFRKRRSVADQKVML